MYIMGVLCGLVGQVGHCEVIYGSVFCLVVQVACCEGIEW